MTMSRRHKVGPMAPEYAKVFHPTRQADPTEGVMMDTESNNTKKDKKKKKKKDKKKKKQKRNEVVSYIESDPVELMVGSVLEKLGFTNTIVTVAAVSGISRLIKNWMNGFDLTRKMLGG